MNSAGFTEDDIREMVVRLAHEIRNPLATIKSAAQLLEHLQPPGPEVAECYSSIYAEVRRIDSVIRDMQRYARLDVQTARSIDVEETITTVTERLSANDRSAAFRVYVAGGPATQVLIDPAQLEFALEELITNGLQASDANQLVRVAWEHRDRHLVAISVEDTGPGIPEEYREKVFRPFFSTSTQGTGLGLNIVAKTCEIVGGSVTFENLEPHGACFTLAIPRV